MDRPATGVGSVPKDGAYVEFVPLPVYKIFKAIELKVICQIPNHSLKHKVIFDVGQ